MRRPRRVRIVVNPSARSGRGARALRGLEAAATPGVAVEWVESRSSAHLRDLVAEAEAAAYDAVAVAGGDGSVRHALAALGSPSRIPLGVIPIGSGNDFAREAGIPRDATAALSVIAAGAERAIDVALAGGTRYASVASIGFDEIALDVVHRSGLPRGRLLNVAAALWALLTYRPRPLRIRWAGGEHEGEVMFAAVTNTRGYGGGIVVSPRARLDDGLLDLCVVPRAGRLGLIATFARILGGARGPLPGVLRAQSAWVTIEDPRGGARAAIDGELPDTRTPLDIRCQPGAVRLLAPARSPQRARRHGP